MSATLDPQHEVGDPMPTTTEHHTMRAITQDRYGSADVLELRDVARPQIRSDEVLVRVRAAGVDRGVWHLMEGLPYVVRPMFGLRRPRNPVLGMDLAGVVEAVGAEVTRFGPGDEVFGIGMGTFAEFARAKESKLATKPASLTFEQVAVVPISGLTALQAVRDEAEVQADESVLVIGASGGVGAYVVQIAAALGARVTGVCSAAKADLVRSLGAGDVIDYALQEITDSGERYDVIIDIGGNRPVSLLRRALAPRGRLVIVGGEDGGRLIGGVHRGFWAAIRSLFTRQKMGMFLSAERSDHLEDLVRMIDAGAVAPSIGGIYELDDAPQAIHDLAAGRAQGKLVIRI